MTLRVRALNSRGQERFANYLAQLRKNGKAEPPVQLLEDSALTRELPADINVERRGFANRLELGKYLCAKLEPLRPEEVDRNVGLWAWLTLLYFDQVCPVGKDGTRRPGQDTRHVPDFSFRSRYRHLLYGPYHVYRRHGVRSMLLLCGPPHRSSSLFQEFMSRQDLIANRGAIEAAMLLYFDTQRMAPKRGATSSKRPGSVRRFASVLQQLDLTYDIFGLGGKAIVELLPPEFERWR